MAINKTFMFTSVNEFEKKFYKVSLPIDFKTMCACIHFYDKFICFFIVFWAAKKI